MTVSAPRANPNYGIDSSWGPLPPGWKTIPVKRLGRFEGGGTPSKDVIEFWKGNIPWVSPKDMKFPTIQDSEDKISDDALRNSATHLIPAGSLLLVVRSGILNHSIPAAIAGRELALNQDMKAFISAGRITHDYLRYFIEGLEKHLLALWRKEGATVESLELEAIANTKVPVPSVGEQRAIVAFLDRETARINALIAKKERLLELLEEKRTALITRAVTKGLDPAVPMKDSGVEWVREVPTHWEVRRLKQLVSKIGSGKTPSGGAEVYVEDGVMLLRSQNVHFGDLRFDEVAYIDEETHRGMAFTDVHEGDVLLNITGASLGRCCVARLAGRRANVNQHVCIIRSRPGRVVAEFLAAVMASNVGQSQIFTMENGISRDALNFGQIGNLTVPVPPIGEQEAISRHIASNVERIGVLADKVGNAIALLREYRTALISAAVTGQIHVSGSTVEDERR